MTIKQFVGNRAPDGSTYVAITDGAGILAGGSSRSATGTKSNVASFASSVTILAANTARLGMSVYNDSTQILYLDMSGGTASTSSYTVQLAANAFYEAPFNYTGLITGIWASANGSARVTEFT